MLEEKLELQEEAINVEKNINEITRIKPNSIKDEKYFWALYSVSFYENLFQKIDDVRGLQFIYNQYLKDPALNGRAREALTFFYRIRRDELADPEFWNKIHENKNQIMQVKLVKESLNDNEFSNNSLNFKIIRIFDDFYEWVDNDGRNKLAWLHQKRKIRELGEKYGLGEKIVNWGKLFTKCDELHNKFYFPMGWEQQEKWIINAIPKYLR